MGRLREFDGVPPHDPKLREAMECADKMEAYRQSHYHQPVTQPNAGYYWVQESGGWSPARIDDGGNVHFIGRVSQVWNNEYMTKYVRIGSRI